MSHFSAALCCVFLSSYVDEKADLACSGPRERHGSVAPLQRYTHTVQVLSVDLHRCDFYPPHIHFTLCPVTCYMGLDEYKLQSTFLQTLILPFAHILDVSLCVCVC